MRSTLIFLLSLGAIVVMLPGVEGGAAWAGYVMLAGVIGLGLFVIRCFWGLAVQYRRKSIPAWLI